MIKVTKLNGEQFVLNCNQIEAIESIPETKIILLNKAFFIVQESPDEIIERVMDFFAKIDALHKHTVIVKKD